MLPRLTIPDSWQPPPDEAGAWDEDTPREPSLFLQPRPSGSLPSSPSARKTKSRASRAGRGVYQRTNSLRDAKVLVVSDMHRTDSGLDPALFQYHQHFDSPWQLVGKTALSEVFRVRHRSSGEVFAVKRSRRRFRSKLQRERCLREIRAVAALPTHPNIVNQYRAWQEGGHFYIQMDFCEGGSLAQWLQQASAAGRCMTDEQLWSTACQAAQGLAFLHSHGVMHLDIKPDNIYLSASATRGGAAAAAPSPGAPPGSSSSGMAGLSPSPGGVAGGDGGGCNPGAPADWATCRIGDFGLAVARDAGGSMDWEEGDGDYVAPELLAAGGEPSPASDIFSLGATLFECATGQRLPRSEGWSAEHAAAMRVDHRPAAFVQLLRAMLQPNPAARPTSQQILEAVCREQPALAEAAQAAVDAAAAEARAERAAGAAHAALRHGRSSVPPRHRQARQAPAASPPGVPALQPSPFMQPHSQSPGGAGGCESPADVASPTAAAAAADQFSFDVPQPCPSASGSGFAFTPGQPLRPHNRQASGGIGGPPGSATKVRGTPAGRSRMAGSRWAPALSPLISEGALTPGAAAALAGLTPVPGFRRASLDGGRPTPQLFGRPSGSGEAGSAGPATGGSGGSAGLAGGTTPLDMWRPAPLQLPPSTVPMAILSSGSAQMHGSGGTQDSRDGWRLSRRDLVSPDSDLFNGSLASESEYSYSCGTGRTSSDMDFADTLSPMSAELGFFASGHTPSSGTPESQPRAGRTPASAPQQPAPSPLPPMGPQHLAPSPFSSAQLPAAGANQQQQQHRGAAAVPAAEGAAAGTVAGRLAGAGPPLAWDLHTSPEFLMQLPPGSPDSLSRSSSLDDAASLPSRGLTVRRFPTLDSWGSQMDGACSRQPSRLDSLAAMAAQRFTSTFAPPPQQPPQQQAEAGAAEQAAAGGEAHAGLGMLPVTAGRALRKRQHSSRRTLMAALSRDNSVASSIDGMAPVGKARHVMHSGGSSPSCEVEQQLAPHPLHRSASTLGREAATAAAALADAAAKALAGSEGLMAAAPGELSSPIAATPGFRMMRCEGTGEGERCGAAPPSPLHARMTGLKLRGTD